MCVAAFAGNYRQRLVFLLYGVVLLALENEKSTCKDYAFSGKHSFYFVCIDLPPTAVGNLC